MFRLASDHARLYSGDVASEADGERLVDAVNRRFGSLAVLVKNVGVAGPPGTAVVLDNDAWACASPQVDGADLPLRDPGDGRERRRLDRQHHLGAGPALLYATSKGAIINLTRAMAAHRRPRRSPLRSPRP